MSHSVYIETTVISYLTARRSRDLVIAAHQEITEEWWQDLLPSFEAFVSPVVLAEISRGDERQVQARLEAVAAFDILEVSLEVEGLAATYMEVLQIPPKAEADALHLALAAWHGLDFMVTWNCKHLANGFIRRKAEGINEQQGIRSPTICTPEELMDLPL